MMGVWMTYRPLPSTAAAVANAVYDAVGIRVDDLPLKPERVYSMLKRKNPGP